MSGTKKQFEGTQIPLPEITNLNILEDMSLVIFQQTVQEYRLLLTIISLRHLSMPVDRFFYENMINDSIVFQYFTSLFLLKVKSVSDFNIMKNLKSSCGKIFAHMHSKIIRIKLIDKNSWCKEHGYFLKF